MSVKIQRFKFGEFCLDSEEKTLLRNGLPISITPKAFELLTALVQNHGHLIQKDELMRTVWTGNFVEEGNLPYTIRLLRKVLEDDSHNPHMIETVPRRGYRFIAEVFEVTGETKSANENEETSALQISKETAAKSGFEKYLLPVGAVLVLALIGGGFWLEKNRIPKSDLPILSAPFSLEKITNSGNTMLAVVSPDGRNVFYTNSSNGKTAVWLRRLDSLSNVEIIPPSEDVYRGLSLSPDGNFLYFARSAEGFEGQLDIYRVSIFGGIPLKIIKETQGWISVSPDGQKISFVRCYYRDDEFCSLWTADSSTGKNERKLLSRPRPFRIGDNKISPDGSSIAFAVGQSENQGNQFGLSIVDIRSGSEREVTEEKFFNIKGLVWAPDGNSMMITASRIPNKHFLIWKVSLPSGDTQPLTTDSETYSSLSMNRAASVLIATQVKQDFHIQLYQADVPTGKSILTDGVSVTFAPNGIIVFSSLMSGNDEIWSIDSDGNNRKQLTNNKSDDSRPIVSPDGNSIYFSSNRTGEAHVWRMNSDGSDQTRITRYNGGFPLFASADGNWVYYHHGLDRTLWRAATDGRNVEHQVYDKARYRITVSPDETKVAFFEKIEGDKFISIYSLKEKRHDSTYKLEDKTAKLIDLVWAPGGKYLYYVLGNTKSGSNTLWKQPLGLNSPQKIADLEKEEISEVSGLAISFDEKRFAIVQGKWRHDAILLRGLK